MREEFHGINNATFKQLYGWGTLNTNVWLPSMSELIGIDPSAYRDGTGTYYSAMQGLNTSTDYFADAQGGNQFAYFQQYNTSGGGQKTWEACSQQTSWIRSIRMDSTTYGWIILSATYFHTPAVTDAYAVHPAVLYKEKV